ncbi:hypothetical protein I317_07668 [Kwoniella heveanensis CBS 569]|nr:hypothetical protein I317_07668 [Kwoniella heveanensis CBS 569]
MVEIITHGVQLIAAHRFPAKPEHLFSRESSSGTTTSKESRRLNLSSSSALKGRYRLDLTLKGNAGSAARTPGGRSFKGGGAQDKVMLSFCDPTSQGDLYHNGEPELQAKVEFTLGVGKKLGRVGWERLEVYEGGGSETDRRGKTGRSAAFSAYRLIDPKVGLSEDDHHSRQTILIFAQQDTANFLSRLPDGTPLGGLTLPGTHESCALYGYPISQCQQPSTPILQQLRDGIRFLDVRLRVVGGELLMYHGPRPQRSTLTILLSAIHDFLSTHPGETLILCIKQETPPWHPHFSSLLYKAFKPFLDRWFLEERIPTLGEVRGKGILLSRFDRSADAEKGDWEWEEGMGIHPSRWPDSREEGFEWDCAGTTVRTQDWYRVHTFLQIPEKLEAIITHLDPTIMPSSSTSDNDANTPFTLSYTSASYFPLSLPTIIAKGFGYPSWNFGVEGINIRFCRYLLGLIRDGKRIRATVAMDFYRQSNGGGLSVGDGNDLADLLVLMNVVGVELADRLTAESLAEKGG